MKERPILFSAPMVRAILDGRKTQTRRVIKPQPTIDRSGNFCWNGSNFGQDFNGPRIQAIASPIPSSRTKRVLCPFGKPGDRLWVRESFWGCDLPGYGDQPCVVYVDEWSDKTYQPTEARPWARKFGHIPSIHMPRDCSRINLEIAGVRVERLQDISEDDAMAEGVTVKPCKPSRACRMGSDAYAELWETINGAGSWDANPWVWVVEFRRIP